MPYVSFQEIRDLLQKWKDHIFHADRIFLSWPQRAKSILFDGKEPMLEKCKLIRSHPQSHDQAVLSNTLLRFGS